jgi:hypothetical protein
MNFIFNDNVRILCLSCNVKKVGKFVRVKQKGQKQVSFLTFHKSCQGCLLRGPRYIVPVSYLSAPSAVHSYRVPGKFIRIVRKVYLSSTNKAKNYSYSIFVQQMYWLQDKTQYVLDTTMHKQRKQDMDTATNNRRWRLKQDIHTPTNNRR